MASEVDIGIELVSEDTKSDRPPVAEDSDGGPPTLEDRDSKNSRGEELSAEPAVSNCWGE